MSRLAFLRSAAPQKIGLLGGSFNPAHEGHVHISLEALRRLELDRMIWLVSPANPLKDIKTLAPFEKRYDYAQRVMQHPKIIVSDFENHHQLFYTHDTITKIQASYPRHYFIWIMGGDNLANFHHWQGWRDIADKLPIAVLDRAPFATAALRSHAAQSLQPYRTYYRQLATASTPAWDYVPIRRHHQSATKLRSLYGENTWQSHIFQS
jgi:nicotinate-nucleotide adenylyltransferase